MTKIIDRRRVSLGGASNRLISQIKNIAVHYSATPEGTTAAFERYWKSSPRNWKTGGYSEVVLLDGSVELNYDATVITNGVKGHNTSTYSICYVGDGQPNAKQKATLIDRIASLRADFNIPASNVKGHREFSGASTQCPKVNVKDLVVAFAKPVSKPTPTKKPSSDVTRVKLTVDGKWGGGTTKALQRALGTKADGIISKQSRNYVTESLYGGVNYGKGGSVVIKALQKKINARVDGLIGPATIKALQKYLGTAQDGVLSRPSLVVKAMQRRLNAGTF